MSLKRTTTEQGQRASLKKAHLVCGCPNSDQPNAANRSAGSIIPRRLHYLRTGKNPERWLRGKKIEGRDEREDHDHRSVVQLGIALVAQRLGVRRRIRIGFGNQTARHGRTTILTTDRRSDSTLRLLWDGGFAGDGSGSSRTHLREDHPAKQSHGENKLRHHWQCSQGHGHGATTIAPLENLSRQTFCIALPIGQTAGGQFGLAAGFDGLPPSRSSQKGMYQYATLNVGLSSGRVRRRS